MDNFYDKVRRLRDNVQEIIIYGAGLYGQNICKILKKEDIKVDGFAVTVKTNETTVLNLPVYAISEVVDKNIGIIVGMNRHNSASVISVLKNTSFNDDKIIWGYEFIDNNGIRGGYDEIPTMEITTRIGCSVNCKFCPQNVLLEQYFTRDDSRSKLMSIENFKTCLDKLPDNCTILFSGMAEPFLNPKCGEMLQLACDSGRKVDLYTTLVGTDDSDIKLISELPLGFIGLHVADKRNYANIPISKDYYDKLDFLLNRKKKNGEPLVNVCNAQTEPDEKVAEICGNKYNILTTMLDRAGNLKDEQLYRKQCLSGTISCSLCGDKLNHNILLPDGTVLLCCMDYGMRHVLGNLIDDSYDNILNGFEISFVKKGLLYNQVGDSDILCRSCSCANICI